MILLTERYAGKIRSVLSGRVFDCPKFAEPLRDEIRLRAERCAQEDGLEIDFKYVRYFIDHIKSQLL